MLPLLLLLAWGLHWHAFGVTELGADGTLSVDLAHIPITAMLTFTARDVHPPLFYAALHGWFDLVGATYLTAKYLPIASGLIAAAALAGLAKRLIRPPAGALAAALFIISPADIYLASTVRDYMPGLACSLLTLLLTLRLGWQRGAKSPSRRALVGLTLLTAAALLTWYFQFVFLVAEAALLVGSRASERRRAVGGALAAGCVLALPWYAYAAPKLLHLVTSGATAFDGAPSLPTPAAAAGELVKALTDRADALGMAATIGWALVMLSGIAVVWRADRCAAERTAKAPVAKTSAFGVTFPATTSRLLLVGLLLGLAAVLPPTLRWAEPGALVRYILVLLPFAVLLQAAALASACRVWRGLTTVALLLVVVAQGGSYMTLVRSGSLDYTDDATFAYLAAHAEPGDVLLFTDRQRRARYQLSGGTLPTAVIDGAGARYLLATPAQASAIVANLAPRFRRIWYVESSLRSYASTLVTAPLSAAAYPAAQQRFDAAPPRLHDFMATTLGLYLTSPPDIEERLDKTLGRCIILQAASYTGSTTPGGSLSIKLHWQDERAPAADYTVFVHLNDAAGRLVAQHDGPPAAGLRPTGAWRPGEMIVDRHGLDLPESLTPGEYQLVVGLYRGDQRLTLPDGDTTITLGAVRLG